MAESIKVRQDALKEELARKIAVTRGLSVWERLPDRQGLPHGAACKEYCYGIADDYIQTFTKAGVVLKVDGKRPVFWGDSRNPTNNSETRYSEGFKDCRDNFDGYTLTAPLKE